jgi:hypothetical protein
VHERGDIVRQIFGGIGALESIRFARSSQVEGDAGKVFGVLCDLERVTSVIADE